ncbi:MAG: CaiB/BaiF CoA-transferase family protein [Pseudomonadota bacterium]
MGTKPLVGVRVLDLTNVLAGPFCCYQLALLGADVIKVERPGTGDLARQLGADPERSAVNMGISFLAQNSGKRSLTLDLKQAAGKAVLKRLLAGADVLVENFRPGVMERLGLGYETLKTVNPSLIYCAISGYGQTGPWKDNPAYDQIIQGLSGVMSVTGDEQSTPLRVGYPLADTVGGMTAAFAISAALNEKPRGTCLDVSMTEAVLSTMGWVVSNHLIGDVEPQALGNENMTSAPSGTFRTADAPINIAANRDSQWEALAKHLGRADLLDHSDYTTREDRKRNRDALRSELEKTLTERPAKAWVEELNALGVPTGPVMSVPDILAEEQIRQRGLVGTAKLDDGEMLRVLNSPVVVDGKRPGADLAPPELGAHTAHVLAQLGYTDAEISQLKDEGVI